MALTETGSLGLKYNVGGVLCTSIACAVDGNTVGNKSLCSLSVSAGKSSPHCMREFYGYNPVSLSVNPTSVSFSPIGGSCTITVTATAGLSWTAYENLSWVTIDDGSGGVPIGTGNGSFRILTSKNFSTCAGNVCVTSSAPTELVSVYQGV